MLRDSKQLLNFYDGKFKTYLMFSTLRFHFLYNLFGKLYSVQNFEHYFYQSHNAQNAFQFKFGATSHHNKVPVQALIKNKYLYVVLLEQV
jgi:hypothetical protein